MGEGAARHVNDEDSIININTNKDKKFRFITMLFFVLICSLFFMFIVTRDCHNHLNFPNRGAKLLLFFDIIVNILEENTIKRSKTLLYLEKKL